MLERLCEECGEPTGPTFYVVEDEFGDQEVCHDCYEQGRDEWLSARLISETEEELGALESRIRDAFPKE
jgi:hypothetical protein